MTVLVFLYIMFSVFNLLWVIKYYFFESNEEREDNLVYHLDSLRKNADDNTISELLDKIILSSDFIVKRFPIIGVAVGVALHVLTFNVFLIPCIIFRSIDALCIPKRSEDSVKIINKWREDNNVI